MYCSSELLCVESFVALWLDDAETKPQAQRDGGGDDEPDPDADPPGLQLILFKETSKAGIQVRGYTVQFLAAASICMQQRK